MDSTFAGQAREVCRSARSLPRLLPEFTLSSGFGSLFDTRIEYVATNGYCSRSMTQAWQAVEMRVSGVLLFLSTLLGVEAFVPSATPAMAGRRQSMASRAMRMEQESDTPGRTRSCRHGSSESEYLWSQARWSEASRLLLLFLHLTVNRRNFLQQSALAAGVLALMPSAASAKGVKRIKNAPLVTLPSGVTYQVRCIAACLGLVSS